MGLRALVAIAAVGACVRSSSVECADGTVCPEDATCVQLAGGEGPWSCASPDQLAACADPMLDGTLCHFGAGATPGICTGGVCAPSDGSCGNRLVDIATEQCDDGNRISHDGCDSRCQVEVPEWEQLLLDPPIGRSRHVLAYDRERGVTVMFGGATGAGPANLVFPETWELGASGWRQIATTLEPSGRVGAGMAYDAARREVVLFGGDDRVVPPRGNGDTWTWNGLEWRPRIVPGPPARFDHMMAYDARRAVTVMFGGARDTGGLLPETWEWDGTAWTMRAIGPPGRTRAAMAYDPVRGQIVLFGGSTGAGELADTWTYDGASWIERTPPVSPPARAGASFAYSAAAGALVLFGGASSTGGLADTWTWNGTTWALVVTGPASQRIDGGAVAEIDRSTVAMVGGSDLIGSAPGTARFDGTRWRDVPTTRPDFGQGPADRRLRIAAHDRVHGRALVYSGSDAGALYELGPDGWLRLPNKQSPPGRSNAALAYDETRAQLVLFGGSDAGGGLLSDTWIATRDDAAPAWAWHQVATPPQLSARADHALAYDPVRQRVVLFGGHTAASELADTWEWDGAAWTQRAPAQSPPARHGHALAFDPSSGQMLLFGGVDAGVTANSIVYADAWLWDGTSWVEPAVDPEASPLARAFAQMAVDADRGSVVMFGGAHDATQFQDVWEWRADHWERLAASGPVPPRRVFHLMVPARDGGVLVIGGSGFVNTSAFPLVDSWRLRWHSTLADELCHAPLGDHDGDEAVGCGDPDCWRVCSPLCRPGGTCAPAVCGDGTCAAPDEDCWRCPADCGACAVCGDMQCDAGEACPGDCP